MTAAVLTFSSRRPPARRLDDLPPRVRELVDDALALLARNEPADVVVTVRRRRAGGALTWRQFRLPFDFNLED